MNTYKPSEFLRKLSANELSSVDAPTIAGLVKHDGNEPGVILFSSGMSCERWLRIPVDMIEDVTHLRLVRCKDHEHPLVKIRLKQPDKARADLSFLLGLVSEMQGVIARLSLSRGKELPSAFNEGGDCYTVIAGGLVFVCCGTEPTCTGVALTQ